MATFTYTTPADESLLQMFNFLIAPIREEDKRVGGEFVKRFLQGPQAEWDSVTAKIRSIPDLWSVTDIADDHLQFLKWIVGWTSDPVLANVTADIDDATLRRLIAASGRLWANRGPESTIIDVLRLLTKTRLRIWNWFDFRWVLDETELGEEHEGRDPWIINLPASVESESVVDDGQKALSSDGITIDLNIGTFSTSIVNGHRFRITSGVLNGTSALVQSRLGATQLLLQGSGVGSSFAEADWEVVDESFAPDDEYRSDLRIVDDGSLDRTLVKRILRLMRATGERWNITYLDFLDLFNVDGDDLQWQPLSTGNVPVAGGSMNLLDTLVEQETFAVPLGASDWVQYVFSARVRGTSSSSGAFFGLVFYHTNASNHYRAVINTFSQEFRVQSVVGAVLTDLAIVDLGAIAFNLIADVWYTVRVTITDELPSQRIRVTVDGAELVDILVAKDLTEGTVGFRHDVDSVIEADEAEVFQLPVSSDTLELNESP